MRSSSNRIRIISQRLYMEVSCLPRLRQQEKSWWPGSRWRLAPLASLLFRSSNSSRKGLGPCCLAATTRTDVVFNIQRAALTTAALTTGKWTLLREAMRDRIHQPHRALMIPGLNEILELIVPGLFGIALSGAGPTVFAFTETGAELSVGLEICKVFSEHGIRSAAHALSVDTTGRTIIDG